MYTRVLFLTLLFANSVVARAAQQEVSTTEKSGTPPVVIESDTPHLSSIYSEISNDSRTLDTVFFLRLNSILYKPIELYEIYYGAVIVQDSLSTQVNIYSDNYIAPLIGAKLNVSKLPLFLFTEYRYAFSPEEKPAIPKQMGDFRTGLVGSSWNTYLSETVFNEFYGELTFSTRLENNLILNSFDKIGFQKRLDCGLTPQLFIEGTLDRDRLGNFFENLQEFRLGARLHYVYRDFTFAISEHYAMGSYTVQEYRDSNPYGKNYKEWKTLFVAGGEF